MPTDREWDMSDVAPWEWRCCNDCGECWLEAEADGPECPHCGSMETGLEEEDDA